MKHFTVAAYNSDFWITHSEYWHCPTITNAAPLKVNAATLINIAPSEKTYSFWHCTYVAYTPFTVHFDSLEMHHGGGL